MSPSRPTDSAVIHFEAAVYEAALHAGRLGVDWVDINRLGVRHLVPALGSSDGVDTSRLAHHVLAADLEQLGLRADVCATATGGTLVARAWATSTIPPSSD